MLVKKMSGSMFPSSDNIFFLNDVELVSKSYKINTIQSTNSLHKYFFGRTV